MPSGAPVPPRVAEVTEHVRTTVESGRLDLPLPVRGRTLERWRALLELAAEDLCVARLAEAHLDALTILTELHGPRLGLTPWEKAGCDAAAQFNALLDREQEGPPPYGKALDIGCGTGDHAMNLAQRG